MNISAVLLSRYWFDYFHIWYALFESVLSQLIPFLSKAFFLIINDRVPIKLFSARFIGFFHDAYITFIFTEIIGARIWFVRLWLVITDYPIFFVIKSVEINRREKNVNFAALDIWSDNFIIMDLFTFEICDMHPKTVSR